jgi:hypothetical protein
MAFTVIRPGGTTDFDIAPYALLLEKRDIDLTQAPRTPEPKTENRWLYVWKDWDEAETFARELRKRSKDKTWQVQEVPAERVSEGPLGPVQIDVGCQSDGCTYVLSFLARLLLKKRFPHTHMIPNIFIGKDVRSDKQEQFADAVWDHVAVLLTGLSLAQLDELGGYSVFDTDSYRLLRKPPPLNGTRE